MARRSPQPLTVSAVARAVQVHPNTVRLYEAWGLLPPIPRTPKGYRQYSRAHLEQMRLARIALPGPFPGGGQQVYALVKEAAKGRFREAIRLAGLHAVAVAREQASSLKAYRELVAWATGRARRGSLGGLPLFRREAARRLGCTVDALRSWERNGLLRVERDAHGYCRYGADAIHRARVVRSLRKAGYSAMAILRMFREYERGNVRGLKRALNTPAAGADVVYVSDRWLSTLQEHRRRARRILLQLASMRKMRTMPSARRAQTLQ